MSVKELTAAGEMHLTETMDFLRAMMDINSYTTNVTGVAQLSHCVAQHFATLGFEAINFPTECPDHGSHLVLQHPQPVDGPTIALVTHLDTVFSEEEERANDFAWRVEGDRIYGPGANDIKGGTATIYLLLKVLSEVEPVLYKSVNWMILANACEEVDSEDFAKMCREVLPATTNACLIFEADGGPRDTPLVVEARKGRAVFEIAVEGRAAHAGSAHQQGANAIVALADAVHAVAELTDYDAGVTVNVGLIHGGTVTNRVPHEATAIVEMRAFDQQPYQQVRQQILDLSGSSRGCEIRVSVQDDPPWPRNPSSENLLKIWQQAGEELGVPVASMTRGGLSDGNVLWKLFPTLDGLGPSGENCHCSIRSADGKKDQEWVDAKSFVPKTTLNALALKTLLVRA